MRGERSGISSQKEEIRLGVDQAKGEKERGSGMKGENNRKAR